MSKIKTFQKLEISDSFLFAALMEDADICRELLQIVLETEIERVWVRTERTIALERRYRSVRLDVFVEDQNDNMYDLEMQGQKSDNLFKRSRYYQSQMDAAALKPRGTFGQLRKSYVIFICLFDPFGRGKYRYTFEERCREEDFPLEDETKKIFLSTEGVNDSEVPEELVHFLKYVKDASAALAECNSGSFVNKVDRRIQALKYSSRLEEEYMLFGELLDEQRAEGRAEGKTEILTLINALVRDGKTDLISRLEEPDFLESMLKQYGQVRP